MLLAIFFWMSPLTIVLSVVWFIWLSHVQILIVMFIGYLSLCMPLVRNIEKFVLSVGCYLKGKPDQGILLRSDYNVYFPTRLFWFILGYFSCHPTITYKFDCVLGKLTSVMENQEITYNILFICKSRISLYGLYDLWVKVVKSFVIKLTSQSSNGYSSVLICTW